MPIHRQFPTTFLSNFSGVTYELRDEFTTDAAAGSIHGTAMEPGPGTRTAVDTNSIMSIAGGLFVWDGTCAANNNLRSAAAAHLGGRAWGWVVPTRTNVSVRLWHGLFLSAGDLNQLRAGYIYTAVNAIRVKDGGTDVYNVPALGVNEHCFAVIERPGGGAYLFGRNGLTGSYKLLFVYAGNTSATLLQALCENTSAQSFTMDAWKRVPLSGIYASDWGLCLAHSAAPVSGDSINADADGIYQFAWTPASTEILDLQFRRTDDNNCWIFRLDQANSKTYLYEKQAGVETERGAVGGIATTLTVGVEVVVEIRCETQSVFCTVKLGSGRHTTKQTYASASFNQTATGLKVSGFATGANLASWANEVALPPPFDVYALAESSTLSRVSQQTLGWTNVTQDWAGRAVLAELASGRWIAAYRTATLHTVEQSARIRVRFSDDEGVTWSSQDTLPGGATVTGMPLAPQVADKALPECVLILCPNDDLLIHAYERAGGGTSQWRSTDDGATWTYSGIINSDTTLVASDDYKVVGSRIYLISRVDPASDFVHPHYLALYISDDNGVSWTKLSDVEAVLDCNEAGLLHVSGNTFHVYVKDSANLNTYRYVSTDACATWTARQTVTNELHWMNKPKCKTLGGYHWCYGRDARDVTRTVVYRSADALDWEPPFYPFTVGTEDEDNGYCDLLQRADGTYYLLSYAGNTVAETASVTEAVFEQT